VDGTLVVGFAVQQFLHGQTLGQALNNSVAIRPNLELKTLLRFSHVKYLALRFPFKLYRGLCAEERLVLS
jgi:hypothetical protein